MLALFDKSIQHSTFFLTMYKEWWWNEEVAEAVRNKKIKYGKWKKENTE